MFDLLKYMSIMTIGILLSRSKIIPNKVQKRIEKAQTIALYFMLAAMGYKIGTNKEILENFHVLGAKALVITAVSMIISMVLVHIIYHIKSENK